MSAKAELFHGAPADWDAFISGLPAATSSHLYGWRRVIERVYGHACPYLITREGDRLTGALPLVDVRSVAFGRFLVSMPFLNAGGPLGDPDAVTQLTEAAVSLAGTRKASLVELRCTSPIETTLEDHAEKVACVLTLPATVDQLWSALGGKVRNQVKRPQKEGIEVRFGADQLEPFFGVFARNMRDLGSPTHRLSFFRAIAEELPEQSWFGCAYLKGVPIAGGCGISWRGEVEMTWASAIREYNALSPNMLLYWAFMERAVTLGFERFNFGRSTPGSGAHRFKLQWGAKDHPLHWYRSSRRAGAALPRQDAGSMSLATRIWRHVPLPVATLIGGRLRGGIPA